MSSIPSVKYRLKDGQKGTYSHASLGEVHFDFPSGDVIPKSEQEEEALAHLARSGLAEPIADKPKGSK